MALFFTGFEFQENSADNSIGIKDCWDGNKCNLDKHFITLLNYVTT